MNGLLDFLGAIGFTFSSLVAQLSTSGPWEVALKFIPFALFLEFPVQATIMLGILKWACDRQYRLPIHEPYYPCVSCVVLCYAEGDAVKSTIHSLTEQTYPGHIELVIVVDGSKQNCATLAAVNQTVPYVRHRPNRSIKVLPKLQRGGRVSGCNLGLEVARGEIVMALDGDTSFDNDVVANAVPHFRDLNVVGVAGNLRVRNARKSIATRLQAIEYMLSIHASRIGLDQFNVINNISGAFGVFRKKFIQHIGGWDSGTAEDLDLTLRIKKYFGRYPGLRIRFEPYAIGHTDAPESLRGFFRQRLRWDGDLSYLYLRKYRNALRPRLLGWKNFLMLIWTGLLFQIVLPFVIVVYTTYIFLVYSPVFVFGVLLFIYACYLLMTVVFFLEYLVLVSERPSQDLALVWCLPLFPGLMFASRAWCGIATLSEIFLKAHLDSSMAPWWVLRKTRF